MESLLNRITERPRGDVKSFDIAVSLAAILRMSAELPHKHRKYHIFTQGCKGMLWQFSCPHTRTSRQCPYDTHTCTMQSSKYSKENGWHVFPSMKAFMFLCLLHTYVTKHGDLKTSLGSLAININTAVDLQSYNLKSLT